MEAPIEKRRSRKRAIKIERLRELLNKNTRLAGQLASRILGRSHVSIDKSVQHLITGWANEAGTAKSIDLNIAL